MEEVLHPQSSLKSDSIYSIFVTYGRMVPELMVTRELLMCSHQSEIQTSTGLLLAPARSEGREKCSLPCSIAGSDMLLLAR